MAELAPQRPFIELTHVRFRLWPILLAAVLMHVILTAGREVGRFLLKAGPAGLYADWTFMLAALFFQALFGYIGIMLMRRLLPEADAHVRWPPGPTYIGPAILIGIGMGLVMLVADYWPDLLAMRAPAADYDTSPVPATGMLIGMLCTGFAEETIFRGLLVGMLVVLMPGRLRIGSIDLPLAAYVVAVLFGLAHWRTFAVAPLHLAIAQQIYAFVWGLIYVWLMERSKSLVAPIVAHGVGNAVEVSIVMLMMETLRPMA